MGLFLFFCGKVYIVMYFFCIYKISYRILFGFTVECKRLRLPFSLQNESKNVDVARWFAFADGFHYVKLMTEKSEKKMLCCKICLL